MLTREEIMTIIEDLEENIAKGDEVFKSMMELEWYKGEIYNLNKKEGLYDIQRVQGLYQLL